MTHLPNTFDMSGYQFARRILTLKFNIYCLLICLSMDFTRSKKKKKKKKITDLGELNNKLNIVKCYF